MINGNTTPRIVLAFANDKDAYLKNIDRERQAIFRALQDYDDKNYLKIHKEENISISDIFSIVNRYIDRLAIFHYGGHANGTALQLESPTGVLETAHAGGLAQLLGSAPALKLVFLNGCATRGQVDALLDAGVKLVIATAVPIQDTVATEFSEQFYASLAAGRSIAEAFATARAFVATRYGATRQIEEFHNLSFRSAAVSPELAWGLYVHPQGEHARAWKLPQIAENWILFPPHRDFATTGPRVNDGLIVALTDAVAPHSLKVRRALEDEKDNPRRDIRNIRQPVIASFPSPIGEQLRRLWHEANESISADRLNQLILVYESTTQVFAFAALSELWYVLNREPTYRMTESLQASCRRFLEHSDGTVARIDYFTLHLELCDFLAQIGVERYLPECSQLVSTLRDPEVAEAHQFLEKMRSTSPDSLSAQDLEDHCVKSEEYLGHIFRRLSFIVKYKMATVKDINVIKLRNRQAEYNHSLVQLDQAGVGALIFDEKQSEFTDYRSVILLRDMDHISSSMSLMPFIVDENALKGEKLSRVFFYSHHDPLSQSYNYRSIDDTAIQLIVSQANHEHVKNLFDEFRKLIFSESNVER